MKWSGKCVLLVNLVNINRPPIYRSRYVTKMKFLTDSMRHHPIKTLVALSAVNAACVFIGFYLLKKPVLDAHRINKGDSTERVHQIMGPPVDVFESTDDLRNSWLHAGSFVFSRLDENAPSVEAKQLPRVLDRVDAYEWLMVVILVYYEDDRVIAVYCGGT